MSYISTMKVNDGFIMLADMQLCRKRGRIDIEWDAPKVISVSSRKLWTIGNNIGISLTAASQRYVRHGHIYTVLLNRFCNEHTFSTPREAAFALHDFIYSGGRDKAHVEYMEKCYDLDGEDKYLFHVAGYEIDEKRGLVNPNLYCVNTIHCSDSRKEPVVFAREGKGYIQCEYEIHIAEFINQINADKEEAFYNYSLQNAVDISKTLFDIARGAQRIINRVNTISENFEMIALTPDGIQWLKKYELKVREDDEEVLEVKECTEAQ